MIKIKFYGKNILQLSHNSIITVSAFIEVIFSSKI